MKPRHFSQQAESFRNRSRKICRTTY